MLTTSLYLNWKNQLSLTGLVNTNINLRTLNISPDSAKWEHVLIITNGNVRGTGLTKFLLKLIKTFRSLQHISYSITWTYEGNPLIIQINNMYYHRKRPKEDGELNS